MNQSELRTLIAQTEGLKLDFKRRYKFNHHIPKVRRGQWDEFIKDILALANGNVGVVNQTAYLVIGIGDELSPDGTRDLFDMRGLGLTTMQILDRVNSACQPPLPDIRREIVDLAVCRRGLVLPKNAPLKRSFWPGFGFRAPLLPRKRIDLGTALFTPTAC